MAGWPGSRQSHTARRIRRRETHSALAGQLLFTFDDAEKGEGAVPKGGGGRVAGTCPRELGRSARARGAEQLRLRNAFPPPARAHHTNQTSSRAIVTRLSEPDQSRTELGQTRPPPPTLTPPCNGRVPYPQRGRGGRALRVRFPFAVGDFALRVIGAS